MRCEDILTINDMENKLNFETFGSAVGYSYCCTAGAPEFKKPKSFDQWRKIKKATEWRPQSQLLANYFIGVDLAVDWNHPEPPHIYDGNDQQQYPFFTKPKKI